MFTVPPNTTRYLIIMFSRSAMWTHFKRKILHLTFTIPQIRMYLSTMLWLKPIAIALFLLVSFILCYAAFHLRDSFKNITRGSFPRSSSSRGWRFRTDLKKQRLCIKNNEGVPIVVQWKWIWLVSMRMEAQSLTSLSGLWIQRCPELWCRSQMQLGSCYGCGIGQWLQLQFKP